jgi:hypothetical protein
MAMSASGLEVFGRREIAMILIRIISVATWSRPTSKLSRTMVRAGYFVSSASGRDPSGEGKSGPSPAAAS